MKTLILLIIILFGKEEIISTPKWLDKFYTKKDKIN